MAELRQIENTNNLIKNNVKYNIRNNMINNVMDNISINSDYSIKSIKSTSLIDLLKSNN